MVDLSVVIAPTGADQSVVIAPTGADQSVVIAPPGSDQPVVIAPPGADRLVVILVVIAVVIAATGAVVVAATGAVVVAPTPGANQSVVVDPALWVRATAATAAVEAGVTTEPQQIAESTLADVTLTQSP